MSQSDPVSPTLKKYILLEAALLILLQRHAPDEEPLGSEMEDTLQDIWWYELSDDERTRLDSLKRSFKPKNTPIELHAKTLKALEADDWITRMQAANWLTRHLESLRNAGVQPSLESLLNALHDLNPYVRHAALVAIDTIAGQSNQADHLIQQMTTDTDERVRTAAQAAVERRRVG